MVESSAERRERPPFSLQLRPTSNAALNIPHAYGRRYKLSPRLAECVSRIGVSSRRSESSGQARQFALFAGNFYRSPRAIRTRHRGTIPTIVITGSVAVPTTIASGAKFEKVCRVLPRGSRSSKSETRTSRAHDRAICSSQSAGVESAESLFADAATAANSFAVGRRVTNSSYKSWARYWCPRRFG